MKIRIAGFEEESIVDGEGIRFVVFVQGCPHHCYNCHNPETHDFSGGTSYDTAEIVEMFKSNPLISGITLSGGEPFCQSDACIELAREAHKMGLNVWCYTGFSFNEARAYPLINEVDVLIDGEYIESQKSLSLKFRGSSNQCIIDVRKSLQENSIVLHH